jgi:hypothetical protein
MSYELLHFRGSDNIIKSKNLAIDLQFTLEYIDDALSGSLYKRELLKMVLHEMDWINKDYLSILDGRRYAYKGYKRDVAMESCLNLYEYIHTALFRLQVGFDKGQIEMGIVLVNAHRAEKSPLGKTKELVQKEIDLLYPTISLPVAVALFDLTKPAEYLENILRNDAPVKDQKPASIEVPAIPDKPTEGSKTLYMVHNQPEKQRKASAAIPRSRKSNRVEKRAISAAM